MKTNCQAVISDCAFLKTRTLQRGQAFWLCSLAIGLLLGGSVITTQRVNSAAEPPAPASFCSGRILVKPKEKVSLPEMAELHSRFRSQALRTFPGIGNLQVLKLPPQANLHAIIAAYQRSGRVAYAEPDYTVNVLLEP